MKSVCLRLILCLVSLLEALAQQNIYIDAANTQGNGTSGFPYPDLNTALTGIQSQSAGAYVLSIRPSSTFYSIENNYTLTGSNITFQNWGSVPQTSITSPSSQSCSNMPQIGIVGGGITANSILFNGLQFVTANNTNTSLILTVTQLSISNSCFDIDFVSNFSQQALDNTTVTGTLEDPPTGLEDEYLLLIQGDGTNNSAVALTNIFIGGALSTPPLISAVNIETLQLANIVATSFPQIDAITESTSINGFTVNGSGENQTQTLSTTETKPCWIKIAYSSQMSFEDILITQLNITQNASFFCVYQIQDTDSSDDSDEQGFTVNNLNFEFNNLNTGIDWCLIYSTLDDNIDVVSRNTTISNINVINNTVSTVNEVNSMLIYLLFTGDIGISNVTFVNNTHFKFLDASPENTELSSNLDIFENSLFSNNIWDLGDHPIISVTINPIIELDLPVVPTTTVSNLTVASNSYSKNFFYFENEQIEDEYERYYLTPRATFQNISLIDNEISGSTVFTIQMFNLDLTDLTITDNNLTSSNILQSSAGCSPLQLMNITVENTILFDSNIIYKQFDTSEIVENMDTDYNDNPTPIPYTVYISGFNVKNSSFFEYSTGFKIKAAPLLFIEGCGFENLTFTSSSMLFAISDLLSLLSNIIFDADTVLDFGYTSYLVGIDNDNLISLFEESIPIDEGENSPFQLGYAIDHLTNGLIFIYRITDCEFQNILLNQADLIDITTVSLNQSLVTIDSNTFSNITLESFQDTLVSATTIQVFNFAYNEISQFAGAGATLTSNQVSYLSVTNNYVHDNIGSSFLQMTSDINLDTFIGNNIVNNITSVTTFISLQISSNAGLVLFQNNSFNNCYVIADSDVYRQLNFISIDNEFSIRPIVSPPDFYVNECNFTNIVIYKNHPLIKQYQNSFFVANLADDTFLVENSIFNNISIQYTHNLLVVITEVFQLYNTTISNIENYDTTGSVYILATSVTINNVSFINNTALEGNGAALYLDYDSIENAEVDVTLENCIFQNNIGAQGSIIYYTTKAINLTASNNLFIDNQVSQDSGSLVYFFNVTFTGLSFSQNQIITTKTSSNYFVFFYFDSVKTQSNASLYINDLAVNLSASVSGIIFSVEESNVSFIFDNLTIFNSTLTAEPTNELTIMNIESGQVLLKNSTISNLSSNVRSLIEILCVKEYNSFLQIDGTQFSTFSLQHNPDFLVYTKDYTYTGIVHLSNRGGKLNCNNTLLITDTTFNDLNFDIQNTPLVDPSTVILDYNGIANLTIEGTTFQNLFSEFGPAINLASSSSNSTATTIISSNTFTNTTSYLEGGAIFNSQNNSLSLTSNQFTNCQSQQRSGAVLFSQTILNFSEILSSNTFINPLRYADYDFQDNKPVGTLPTLLNLTFFTPNYISQNMTNQTIFLSNFSGYDLENVNISAILIDALNQTVYDTSATSDAPKQLSLEVLGKFSESRDCDDSTCTLVEPNLPIKGNASEIIEGQVTYSSPEFDISSEYFKMDLRACLNGELDAKVTGDYSGPQCFPCLSGTYALNVSIDTECLGCPEHATCLGGNDIVIDAGYWRPNTSTVQILECRTASACLGGFGSTCLEGRDGFLCDACDTAEKWVKDKNECTLCPSAEKSLLVFILVLLLTFGYQLWYIKAARISNSYLIASSGNAFDTEAGRKIELKITQGMYIRQLTTYSQIFAIITTFNIDFLSLFGSFEAVTETLANPTVALFQSSTCGLIDVGITDERLLYLRILFVTVSPIVKWLLIAAFRLIHWKFQMTEKRVSILLITAICLFLLEQPSIAQQLFTYLSCIQIDGDSNYYLQSDIAYQCYTPDYYLFRNFVVIPGLLFYIGAVPIFLIFVLRKNRKNINDEKLRMNLGAMYNEYTPKAFYWGIILMATKLILIFLGSILDSDVKTKALSIFIVLYIYYALSLQVQPYFRKELYRSERIAFIAYLITVFGSIYYKDNSLGWVQWFILVIITLLNIYVIAMLVWQICKVYLYQSRDIILPLLKRFRGEQSVDIDFSNDDDLNDLDEHSLEKIEERIFKNNSSTRQVNSSKDEESFSSKE